MARPDFSRFHSYHLVAEAQRKELYFQVLEALWKLGKDLGLSDANIFGKLDDLYLAFASEWQLFLLTGSDAIATAIQNDVTLPWLDTDVSGTSIRDRLVAKLS